MFHRVLFALICLILLPIVLCAAQKTTVAPMTSAPVLDGKISPGEWDQASCSPVQMSMAGDKAVTPSGVFYIGHVGSDLYLAFYTDSLPKAPVAKATKHDGEVWFDDAVEFFVGWKAVTYQIIVNSVNAMLDAKGSDQSYTGPWETAASVIDENGKHGFIVEIRMPLEKLGVGVPANGDEIHLQVGMDMPKSNPQALWQPVTQMSLIALPESVAVWNGSPQRIRVLELKDEGRLLQVSGDFAGVVYGYLTNLGNGSKQSYLLLGNASEKINVRGGSAYSFEVTGPDLYYTIKFSATMTIPVIAVLAPAKDSIYVQCDTRTIPADKRTPITIKALRGDKTLWTGKMDLSHMKGLNYLFISYKGWEPGIVDIAVEDSVSGKEIGRTPVKIPEKMPAWMSYRPPTTPLAPAPWTPVKAVKSQAQVWGRVFSFGKTPFLDQVTSLGQNVLASPVRLEGLVNGKPVMWVVKSWRLVSRNDEKAMYACEASSGALKLSVKSTIEFDGMLRMDWTLAPLSKPVIVSNLRFVVPVSPKVGKSYTRYGYLTSVYKDERDWNQMGDIPAGGLSFAFSPLVWIGDTSRGIQWFAEHNADWTPKNVMKTGQIVRSGKSTDLILHLADAGRKISAPVSFTFGLMPSPVKKRMYDDDLTGPRAMSLPTPPQIEEFDIEPADKSDFTKSGAYVQIPMGVDDRKGPGCSELDFRVDWDPVDPKPYQNEIFLMGRADWGGNYMDLIWSAETKSIRITHQFPNAGKNTIAETPVDLKQGEWCRLAFNISDKLDVYLDGKQVISVKDPYPVPALRGDFIGGGGYITIKGWRVSDKPRNPEEFKPGVKWTVDPTVRNLELMQHDPTPLNYGTPVFARSSAPAYLKGCWKYDKANHWMTALPDNPVYVGAGAPKPARNRATIFFDWSVDILGSGGVRDPETFAKYIAIGNKKGIRSLPYGANCINSVEPDFEDFKWDTSSTGPDIEPASMWLEKGESAYFVCPGSIGGRRSLYFMDQAMKLGAGGVYQDMAGCYPDMCSNPMHGHAPAVDPVTGKDVPVLRIFDMRQYMKDMYRMVKHYRKDGLIFIHSTAGFDLPTHSFADGATGGENLGNAKNWKPRATPEAVRVDYMGRQFGINSAPLFVDNQPVPLEYAMAVSAVHGTTPAAMFSMYWVRAIKIWGLSDAFNTASAKWLPYYEADQCPFKPIDKNLLASGYVHKGKNALLMVSNCTEKPIKSGVRIDWKALGLPETSKAVLVNTNEPLVVSKGVIELPKLLAGWVYYVWIGERK